MMIDLNFQVRPAGLQDRQLISDLIFYQNHAHRHLDWRPPLEWLGSPHFWLIEEEGRALAALACPPDPPRMAWIRLFAFGGRLSALEAWDMLWDAACAELKQIGGAQVGVIAMQGWMRDLMTCRNYPLDHHIVMLEWRGKPAALPSLPSDVVLRSMTESDLSEVEQVDADAFEPMWHVSLENLQRAFSQSVASDVLESRGRMIGYQLSTGKADGAHLARLAVRKEAQGFGFGSALVTHLVAQMQRQGARLITVNTQDSNRSSLALYRKLGFIRTGEAYPVFRFTVENS